MKNSLWTTLALAAMMAIHLPGRAQTDSLLKIIQGNGSAKDRAEAMNRLSFSMLDHNLDSAYALADDAVRLSRDADLDTTLARSFICRSFALESMGETDEAIRSVDSGLHVAERLAIGGMLFSAYNHKAKLLREKNETAQSLQLYLKALQWAEDMHDEERMAKSYNSLGVFYKSQQDLAHAEEYHLKALELRLRNGPPVDLAVCYENLGIIYREKKEYPRALEQYRQALDICIREKDSSGIAYSYNDIGAALSLMGNYGEAEQYLQRCIELRERLGERDELAYTFNYLGENYERKGNLSLAEQYLKKSLQTATALGLSKQRKEALLSISDFYARNKRFDSAYHYKTLHLNYSDSLRRKDSEEMLARLQARFDAVRRQQIIDTQQHTLQRRNTAIAGLVLLLALAGLVSVGIFQRNRHRQEKKLQNAILEQQDLATKAVLEAEENERERIAADLHDGIGQLLTAARLNLEAFRNRLSGQSPEDLEVYGKALTLVDESCREVRSVSHSIMPNALIKSGLGSAIKDFVEKIEASRLRINLHTQGLNEALDDRIELIVYRIIQESVNNVIRHSKADQLDIAIIRDNEGLSVSVEDNGIGFNLADLERREGIGMKNIRARVQFLKGTLDIDTRPGKGTLIAFFIPLNSKA